MSAEAGLSSRPLNATGMSVLTPDMCERPIPIQLPDYSEYSGSGEEEEDEEGEGEGEGGREEDDEEEEDSGSDSNSFSAEAARAKMLENYGYGKDKKYLYKKLEAEDKFFKEKYGEKNVMIDRDCYERDKPEGNIFEEEEYSRQLYLPEDFDWHNASLYTPHGKYADTEGQWFTEVEDLKRVSSGAQGEVYIREGTIAGRRVKFISKCWNKYDNEDWRGFWSELYLFASSKYLRQLQGDCVPFVIGVHAQIGGTTCVSMDPPCPEGWREATPEMSEKDRRTIVEAFDKFHANGILHNDVEFRHMLMSANGKVTVIDWQESMTLEGNPAVDLPKCDQKDIEDEGELVRSLVDWPPGSRKRGLKKQKYFYRIKEHNNKLVSHWIRANEPLRRDYKSSLDHSDAIRKFRYQCHDLRHKGPKSLGEKHEAFFSDWKDPKEEEIDATSDYEGESPALRHAMEKNEGLRIKLKRDGRRIWGPINDFKELRPAPKTPPKSPVFRSPTPSIEKRARAARLEHEEREKEKERARKAKEEEEKASITAAKEAAKASVKSAHGSSGPSKKTSEPDTSAAAHEGEGSAEVAKAVAAAERAEAETSKARLEHPEGKSVAQPLETAPSAILRSKGSGKTSGRSSSRAPVLSLHIPDQEAGRKRVPHKRSRSSADEAEAGLRPAEENCPSQEDIAVSLDLAEAPPVAGLAGEPEMSDHEHYGDVEGPVSRPVKKPKKTQGKQKDKMDMSQSMDLPGPSKQVRSRKAAPSKKVHPPLRRSKRLCKEDPTDDEAYKHTFVASRTRSKTKL